ncbi:MAG: cadherin domain-containing protein [Bacteroidales bacterium]
MKHAYSFLTILVILLTTNAAYTQFAGGNGTETDPWQITTVEQLDSVRNHLVDHFILMNDLDFDGTPYNNIIDNEEGWMPIGNLSPGFKGSFDGQGYTISNLYINRPDNNHPSLFKIISNAEISNLTLLSCSIEGGTSAGGICGYSTNSTIRNCGVYGQISGIDFAGGIAGIIQNSSIQSCYTAGTVIAKGTAGGLVGSINEYSGAMSHIDNCYSSCNVFAKGMLSSMTTEYRAGGLVGSAKMTEISSCYVAGSVFRENQYYDVLRGGFIQEASIETSISTSCFCKDFSGTAPGIGYDTATNYVAGLTFDEMFQNSSNSFFNTFSDTAWNIPNAYGLPDLQNVYDHPIVLNKGYTTASDDALFLDTLHILNMDNTGDYTLILENQPDGMVIVDDSIISWTPNEVGIFNYTVTIIDESGHELSKVFIVDVLPFSQAGTAEDPYQITSIEELNYVRYRQNKHYLLMNDLDFSGSAYDSINSSEGWLPIGEYYENFSGQFDGQGHTISNLYINRPDLTYVGLFGYTQDAEILNLNLLSCSITGGKNVGFIGYAKNTNIRNSSIYGQLKGIWTAGGIAGEMLNGSVRSCYSSGTVIAGFTSGGLLGISDAYYDQTLQIENCYSTCNVFIRDTSTSYHRNLGTGGLIGTAQGTAIQNCYVAGGVSGQSYNYGIASAGFISETKENVSIVSSCFCKDFCGLAPGICHNEEDINVSGLSYNDMMQNAYFSFFNSFNDTVWNIPNNYGLPDLQNMYDHPVVLNQGRAHANINTLFQDTLQFLNMDNTGSYSIIIQDYPEGMELVNDSIITWTPNSTGIFEYTVTIIDESGNELSKMFTIDIVPFSQTGTIDDPYQITTVEELDFMRYRLNKHFILMNDLDFNGTAYDSINSDVGWRPIGQYYGNKFQGSFDGNGHTIKNMYINRVQNTGFDVALFGRTNGAEIKNLSVLDFWVDGGHSEAGLIGRASETIIDSCSVSGIIPNAFWSTGLLVGYMNNNSSVSNSSVQGQIHSNNDTCGGMIGYLSTSEISDCSSRITITGAGNFIGGLLGICRGSDVENCNAHVDISATGDNFGGLTGYLSLNSTVVRSSAAGFISGNGNPVGGLVGRNESSSISNCLASTSLAGNIWMAGGFIGYNDGTITDCYSTGNIYDGSSYCGGFNGMNLGPINNCYSTGSLGPVACGGFCGGTTSNIENCHYVIESSEQDSFSGLNIEPVFEGDSIAQMKLQSTFVNWDFTDTWTIEEGSSFPRLQSIPNPPIILNSFKTTSINELFSDTIQVIPMDSEIQSLSGMSNPEGLLIQDTLISWTPDSAAVYNIDILAFDINGDSTRYTEQLEVFPFSGNGSINDPFQIWSINHLDSIRHRADKHFVLMADLDFEGSPFDSINNPEGWLPINDFTGTFNGKGHTINNLYINREYFIHVGLFGNCTNARIDSLNILNCNIIGHTYAGGMTGEANNTEITKCMATGIISSEGDTGGLVGYCHDTTSVSRCYVSAYITSIGEHAGGIVGRSVKSSISNSYVTGIINGNGTYSGGLAGFTLYDTITNCYATARVSGNGPSGGLFGRLWGTSAHNLYFNPTYTNQADGIGLCETTITNPTGLSVTQMKEQSSFPNWDFENTWEITNGTSFPRLQALHNLPVVLMLPKQFVSGSQFNDTVSLIPMDEEIQSANLTEYPDGMQFQEPVISWTTDSVGFFFFNFRVTDNLGNYINYPDSIMVIPYNGMGTEVNPYKITSINELNYIRHLPDRHYILMNDLDFNETAYCNNSSTNGWTPIGTPNNSFTGSFNGNGHTINNLFIHRPDENRVGLFGYVQEGDISNLNLLNCDITGGDYTGALAGIVTIYSTVDSCFVNGHISGFDYTGGFIGYVTENSNVSFSSASINTSGHNHTGGLIGSCDHNSLIYKCHAGDSVQASGDYVGMLAGSLRSSIDKCYSFGTVSGDLAVGGLVGALNYGHNVRKCYSTCNISESRCGGGLAGYVNDGEIRNSYATGTISSDSIPSGFVGYSSASDIDSCYSTSALHGPQYYNPDPMIGNHPLGINCSNLYFLETPLKYMHFNPANTDPNIYTSLLPNEMTHALSFPEFDFSQTWDIVEGSSFPKHQDVYNTPIVYLDFKLHHQGESFQDTLQVIPMDADIQSVTLLNAPNGMTLVNSVLSWSPDSVGLFDFSVKAEDVNGEYTIYSNQIVVAPPGGDGSDSLPFLINTIEDLDFARHLPDRNYKLMTNLNFENAVNSELSENWKPLGTEAFFSGRFDGNGYSIKNLTITDRSKAGLFGYTRGAEIHDIELLNSTISGTYMNMAGGLIGMGIETMINNCMVSGTIDGEYYIGGLAGHLMNSNVSNCFTTGNIKGHNSIGGFIGYSLNTNVNNSYSTSNVEPTSTMKVGGFIGEGSGSITNCYAAGQNSTLNINDGFIGDFDPTSSVTSCYFDSLLTNNVNSFVYDISDPLPTPLMQQQASFIGWDFTNTWEIIENSTYPSLQALDDAPFAFNDTIEPGTSGSFLSNDFDVETLQNNLVYSFEEESNYSVVDGVITIPSQAAKSSLDELITYRIGEIRTNDTLWGTFANIVIKRNSLPVIQPNQSFSVDEHSPNGTGIGTILASDADADSLNNWTIIFSSTDGAFVINDSTGELIVADSTLIDYETNTDYHIYVSVGDGYSTSEVALVIIHLNNINDNPPIVLPNQEFSICENTESIQSLGFVQASDPDGTTQFNDWTIVSGNDQGYFTLNDTTGELQIVDVSGLDYESVSQYELILTVNDSLFTSDPQNITINVTDYNDHAPQIPAGQNFSVSENVPDNHSIGMVQATDEDVSSVLSDYTILSGNEDDIFNMDSNTGEISVLDNSGLDAENNTLYELAITVSDGEFISEQQTISIEILDYNEYAPIIIPSQVMSVNEDANNNTIIDTLEAEDADISATLTDFTIVSGNNDAIFNLDSITGALSVADNTNLDYEETPSYELIVTVSDGFHTSAPDTLTIELIDINDNSPVIYPFQTFSVNDTIANESIIGTVEAYDADTNTVFTDWSIVSGNINNIFAIDSINGEIIVVNNTNLDYDLQSEFILSLRVSDGLNISVPENVTVTVNDCSGLSHGNSNQFIVYPNPVSEKIYLDKIGLGISRFVLQDLTGRILISEHYNGSGYIDVSSLPTGYVILTLYFTNGKYDIYHLIKK